jgi:uridine phosphorylase
MYPILEFDPSREAFIEPSKVHNKIDMPMHCVICFFKEVLDKVISEQKPHVLVENIWEDGPHQVYEIDYKGQRLAFFHPGVGAALSSNILEEVIAFGCSKFIACGGCGVLLKDIPVGHLFVLSGAIRDEGVSYHYLPPGREIAANKTAMNCLIKVIRDRGLPYQVGKTWTTDAPYRETLGKIAKRKEEGCLVVEMEAAAMMAVAQYRNATFGQVVYGGDDLSGSNWDFRGWRSKAEIRENLFWLSADACLALP